MTNRPTWFDVGYADAKAGKECRVPENYAARMGYLRGYEAARAGDPAGDPLLRKFTYDEGKMFPYANDPRRTTD